VGSGLKQPVEGFDTFAVRQEQVDQHDRYALRFQAFA
jgi:hypothetical protein